MMVVLVSGSPPSLHTNTHRTHKTHNAHKLNPHSIPIHPHTHTLPKQASTHTCSASMLMPGLSRAAASPATVDLDCPMCQLRKRNWRERLDFSMTSSSVTVTRPPSALAPTPIIAKFLRNSQPSAPAPTRKTLSAPRRRCSERPKTAICAS